MMKSSILFLFLFLTLAVHGQMATVIAEKANLRGTPSDKGKVVDKLQRGDEVEIVIDSGSGWYLVQAKDYAGWLHGNTIKLSEEKRFTLVSPSQPVERETRPALPPSPIITAPSRRSDPSRTYIRGPRGGCYYLNSKGNKTYVDRSLCG